MENAWIQTKIEWQEVSGTFEVEAQVCSCPSSSWHFLYCLIFKSNVSSVLCCLFGFSCKTHTLHVCSALVGCWFWFGLKSGAVYLVSNKHVGADFVSQSNPIYLWDCREISRTTILRQHDNGWSHNLYESCSYKGLWNWWVVWDLIVQPGLKLADPGFTLCEDITLYGGVVGCCQVKFRISKDWDKWVLLLYWFVSY